MHRGRVLHYCLGRPGDRRAVCLPVAVRGQGGTRKILVRLLIFLRVRHILAFHGVQAPRATAIITGVGRKVVMLAKDTQMEFTTINEVPFLDVGANNLIPWRTSWLTQMRQLTRKQFPLFYHDTIQPVLTQEQSDMLAKRIREISVAFTRYQKKLIGERENPEEESQILNL